MPSPAPLGYPGKIVVDAVPFEANAPLENEAAINGNIMLCIRSKDVSFVEQAKRALDAGAVAAIVVNTDDSLLYMPTLGDTSKIPMIPVLMIKSSDAVRLREHGSALIRDEGKLWHVNSRGNASPRLRRRVIGIIRPSICRSLLICRSVPHLCIP